MEFKKYEFVVIGGGTAGWLTAMTLVHLSEKSLRPFKIHIVVPLDEGTIGVGEASVDSLLPFMESIGINSIELLRETRASFKQSILFKDWKNIGSTYWHPFYEKSLPVEYLIDSIKAPVDFNDLFFNVHLAKKYKSPYKGPYRAGTGIHFDNFLIAKFLKKKALLKGVHLHETKVKDVHLSNFQEVEKVDLEDGTSLEGDLIFDCSGFKSILLTEVFKTPFHSFSKYLLNDRALAFSTHYKDSERVEPWTTAQAMNCGWCWKIPLQNRKGMGYVHSSNHIDISQAEAELRSFWRLEDDVDFRSIKIRTGYHEKVFIGNTIGVGLSSGFIEPLESSGIWLITRALGYVKDFFSDKINQNQFNKFMETHYISTRDFLFIHYKFTQRNDSQYWRDVANLEFPETVQEKIELLKQVGISNDTKKLSETLYEKLWPWDPKAYILVLKGLGWLATETNLKHPYTGAMKKFISDLEVEAELYEGCPDFFERLNNLK